MILENFIVFEGIDGSGTSTQLALLKQNFIEKKLYFTAEPTNSPIGLFIRSILKGNIKVSPSTMAYLFASDRNEHIHGLDGVLAKQKEGFTVFSDRYLFSSLAYQNPICPKALPQKLNEDFPLPEYLFYFDIDPEKSLSRVFKRGETEIYENLAFQEQTRKEYKKIINWYKENSRMKIIEIDASKSIDEVYAKIMDSLKNMPIFKA